MCLKRIFCLVFFVFSLNIYSQSAEFITELLGAEKVTYGQVSYLVAVHENLVSEKASYIDSMNALYQEKLLLDEILPSQFVNYKDLSYFFAKLWDVKGGLMFRISKGSPRYAFNQFKNDGIIPVNIDPHFYPSGRDVLNLFTLGDLKYGKVISSNEEQKSSDINISGLEELKVSR